MAVAQLEEWLLPKPEVRDSSLDIGNAYIEHLFPVDCVEKTKISLKLFDFVLASIPRTASILCSGIWSPIYCY